MTTVTRMDVDYVTMLNTRIVRYRWNTEESDQWRCTMLSSERNRRWDHTTNCLSMVPDYAHGDARTRLAALLARTRNTVSHDATVLNITYQDKPLVADVMMRIE